MIGYYVHHQGSGHLLRMQEVARHLRTPVTVLSSLAPPEGNDVPWVRLPRDDLAPAVLDEQAHGTLHWAPRHDAGLLARAGEIVRWLQQARPTLVVVDVSVEVALLVRLTGTPVVVAAMPGRRTDRPHRAAYDAAETLVAPWPRGLGVEEWPRVWAGKTHYVGAISRFDDRPPPRRPSRPPVEGGRALLLWGFGGSGPSVADVDRMRRATPGWTWEVAGPGATRSADEVWDALSRTDVVVSHGGQNVVAEVAAARVPAVVVADRRPFDEQQHTVRALQQAGLAVGLQAWPEPDRWPGLLRQAQEIGGDGWRRWSSGAGGRRAAAHVDSLVRRLAPGLETPGPAVGLGA